MFKNPLAHQLFAIPGMKTLEDKATKVIAIPTKGRLN
jgi:hypothetical protein